LPGRTVLRRAYEKQLTMINKRSGAIDLVVAAMTFAMLGLLIPANSSPVQPAITKTYYVKNVSVDTMDGLQGWKSPDVTEFGGAVKIHSDNKGGVIAVTGPAGDVETITSLIHDLDVVQPQLTFKIEVVQVEAARFRDLPTDYHFGSKWAADRRTAGLAFGNIITDITLTAPTGETPLQWTKKANGHDFVNKLYLETLAHADGTISIVVNEWPASSPPSNIQSVPMLHRIHSGETIATGVEYYMAKDPPPGSQETWVFVTTTLTPADDAPKN